MIEMSRRKMLSGFVAAPIVVATPGLLMPVKPLVATGGLVKPGLYLVGEIPTEQIIADAPIGPFGITDAQMAIYAARLFLAGIIKGVSA